MTALRILGSVVVALLLIARVASAQVAPPVTVSFDEFGVGTIQNGAVTSPLPLAPGPPSDPFLTSFDAPTPIVYDLSSLGSVTSGDIEILDGPVGPTSLTSDLLRFFQNRLYVYSDADPADAPADVGIPSVLQNNTALVFSEMGPPTGPNGLFGYKPTPGQAGFTPGLAVTYNFTSDVPEPASLTLIAPCTMAPLMRRRRRVVRSVRQLERVGDGAGATVILRRTRRRISNSRTLSELKIPRRVPFGMTGDRFSSIDGAAQPV